MVARFTCQRCAKYEQRRRRDESVDGFITSTAVQRTAVKQLVVPAAAAATTTTATAREREEKYNLLHEGFPKLGAPFTVVLVYFAQGVG